MPAAKCHLRRPWTLFRALCDCAQTVAAAAGRGAAAAARCRRTPARWDPALGRPARCRQNAPPAAGAPNSKARRPRNAAHVQLSRPRRPAASSPDHRLVFPGVPTPQGRRPRHARPLQHCRPRLPAPHKDSRAADGKDGAGAAGRASWGWRSSLLDWIGVSSQVPNISPRVGAVQLLASSALGC